MRRPPNSTCSPAWPPRRCTRARALVPNGGAASRATPLVAPPLVAPPPWRPDRGEAGSCVVVAATPMCGRARARGGFRLCGGPRGLWPLVSYVCYVVWLGRCSRCVRPYRVYFLLRGRGGGGGGRRQVGECMEPFGRRIGRPVPRGRVLRTEAPETNPSAK